MKNRMKKYKIFMKKLRKDIFFLLTFYNSVTIITKYRQTSVFSLRKRDKKLFFEIITLVNLSSNTFVTSPANEILRTLRSKFQYLAIV